MALPDAQLLDFLVVVLAIENVPLLGAFGDGAPLAFNLLPRRLVDLLFGGQQLFQDAPRFHTDGVRVFDKIHLVHRGQRVSHAVGQLVDFVTGESHSTALYFRTSSPFTFLNISW